MTTAIITNQGIEINGTIYQAEYSKAPCGTVTAFVTVGDIRFRIPLEPDHEQYSAALEAWEETYNKPRMSRMAAEQEEQQTMMPLGEPDHEPAAQDDATPTTENEPEHAATPAAEDDPEQDDATPTAEDEPEQGGAASTAEDEPEQPAQRERFEKPWVGTEIKGRGWKIMFDGNQGRTRVVFTRKPSEAAQKAVDAAGFFWSPVMKSWNKKLTFKAFRAAQALSVQLRTICG